jgi:hypothetical protein
MIEYGVILFHNSSSAMQAEAVLTRAKLAVKLIPIPRELSSDCGIALRFDLYLKNEVCAILENKHVEIAGQHTIFCK